MEDQLKARLIGATVLVLLAVLLIPELLSGRKQAPAGGSATESARGTHTVVIDLGGAVAAGARLEPPATAPARPAATGPVPNPALPTPGKTAAAAEPPVTGAPPTSSESKPAVAAATSAPSPGAARERTASAGAAATSNATQATGAAAATKAPAAAAQPASTPDARGKWAVQVGAFSSAASASKLISDLRREGYPAFEAPPTRNGKPLHRVRVGPEAERAAADQLAGRLKAKGLPATVVSND